MGGFAAVAHGFNCVAVPYIALSAALTLVSILLPNDISDRGSVMTKRTKGVATKFYYGNRAIVLMPTMIVLGLALVVYDRLSSRRRSRHS